MKPPALAEAAPTAQAVGVAVAAAPRRADLVAAPVWPAEPVVASAPAAMFSSSRVVHSRSRAVRSQAAPPRVELEAAAEVRVLPLVAASLSRAPTTWRSRLLPARP